MTRTEKLTQCDEILEWLIEHETLTRLEAATELHIFELASRIGELKNKGYNITGTWACAVNKYGRVSRFKKYKLED